MIIKIFEPIDDSHLEKMDQINQNTTHYEDVQPGSEAPAPLTKESLALLGQLGVGLEFLKKDLRDKAGPNGAPDPVKASSSEPQPADVQGPVPVPKDKGVKRKFQPPHIPLDRALNPTTPPDPITRTAQPEARAQHNLVWPLSGAALVGLAIVLIKMLFY